MHIAVFGDLHGNILSAFQRCARWQQETGEQLELILQVGDLGVFPDRSRLDRATRRHSKSDRTVLGFLEHFITSHAEVAAILGETTCPLLFVRGNHEDHAWLDSLERRAATAPLFPVDAYQRLWCLKTGIPYPFQRANETITIPGIGRIGRPTTSQREKLHYIQLAERQRLERLGAAPIDLLLTHDATRDAIYPSSGSLEISQALQHQRPAYHFFGHYGGPTRSRRDAKGMTLSYKLPELAWPRPRSTQELDGGLMGLLHWRHQGQHTFELLRNSHTSE